MLDHPLAAGNLERLLVHGLLLAQPHNYTEALEGPRRPAAPLTVRLAIDLIHSQPELPWNTPSLARRVAASARSLQEGFQRSLGVPPMRYLRNVRLDRVHNDLLTADPAEVTVSQVASRWGFLYLGRFAAAYRERYGQLPSRTLHHAPRPQHDPPARPGTTRVTAPIARKSHRVPRISYRNSVPADLHSVLSVPPQAPEMAAHVFR